MEAPASDRRDEPARWDTRRPRDEAPAREREPERDRSLRGEGGEQVGERGAKRPRRPRILLIAVGVVLGAALVAGGVLYWLQARNYASTDDARIDADVTQMSSRVSGRVTRILFADNQHVRLGKTLIELDPRDLQAKFDQARAQQANAGAQRQEADAQLAVRRAGLDQAKANAKVSEADLFQARQTYLRYHGINPAATTRQQIDDATAAMRSQTARLAASQQAVEGEQAQIEAAKAQVAAAAASVKEGAASAEAAALQLSYTKIPAPVAGRVTHRTVNVGDYVQPGQALFALVHDDLWVAADFKETELARMRPGQAATITVDAVPGVTFHGHVDSFQSGTGGQFSALPAENATGNWVKVVQRLPVKITFDDAE
ncbi:MAG: HlyD family secretion protein, partial [Pseudomonadota bacterium]|nr:HlyD family secretion protein [Pseudomonadota bacterium]